MKFVVAIDGPAAAGKGTIAKAVANHFGFAHLDSGLLYRAVAAKTLEGSDPVAASASLHENDLQADNLRSPEVAQMASKVAAIMEVRSELLEFQRTFAQRDGGAVIDGRDIGTVICPEAAVKLFVTASPKIRAQRRLNELLDKGEITNFDTVFRQVKERDERDANRHDSPLIAASDAVVIDTSDLTIQEALLQAVAVIEKIYEQAL
ncbi:MAG: (d)CMP kinase [Marinovum sp.]|jgi:CMP/dCMP kinase|nr:(d)CMP kinase [Marinovum sp.]MBT6098649.1 (d)CMP kinase [Marinovum sp.]MBT6508736.1 (d)CMP kinase [Marinovum sp.]MBT7907427.1 (d)CMP kinase [Marinovum sp.]MDG2231984.1 d(CMP) kinase [Paracoccaceae bacterium]